MERTLKSISELHKTGFLRAVRFITIGDPEWAVRGNSLPFSHIYLGSDFCPELLPCAEELLRAIRLAERAGLALTLCTPPVSERYLSHILMLLDALAKHAPKTEVVVNDWGLLKALQPYPFPLSAGRTFQKNKRDPRISTLWPRLSPEMREFYRGNNLLHPSFLTFLKRFRVTRLEMDLPPWGIDAQLFRAADVPISLHLSNTFVTTSHVCPTRATFTPTEEPSREKCGRPCLKTTFRLRNPVFASSLVLRGNTYFVDEGDTFTQTSLAESLQSTPIDRLVYDNLSEVAP